MVSNSLPTDSNSDGKMFIFTAPSGAGKTTIVRHLLAKFDFLGFSISATTRDKRAHEIDGKDYHFMTIEEFKKAIAADLFIEWEEVYENQFYGTLRSEVDKVWSSGKSLVFDIDVKGATNIKKFYGSQCMAVFIAPPSLEVLIARLTARNTESPASLEKRIAKVKREMLYQDKFDFILVNDELEYSLMEADHIVQTFVIGL